MSIITKVTGLVLIQDRHYRFSLAIKRQAFRHRLMHTKVPITANASVCHIGNCDFEREKKIACTNTRI